MGNPFVAPPINTYKPFEPPEFDVIRQLLATQYINMAMNPFGVQGAPTGGGIPLPPSWSSSGVGGAQQGTPGAMWNASTGAYGGQMTPLQAGAGVGTPGVPGAPTAPPAWSNPKSDGMYDSITMPPPDANPSVTGTPTEGVNNPNPGTPGAGAGATNPLLAGLAQQNQENSGQGPNKAWNSTAAGNPWAGMNESQFRSSMGNNVGGGGIFGLQRALGSSNLTGAAAGGPTSLPGMPYLGSNHEWGGNPTIGAAATNAGWNPNQTAAWTVNGMLAQDPTWGAYLSGGNQGGPIGGFQGGQQPLGNTSPGASQWSPVSGGMGGAIPNYGGGQQGSSWQTAMPWQNTTTETGMGGQGGTASILPGIAAESANGPSITGMGGGAGEGLNNTTPGPLTPGAPGGPGSGSSGNPWSSPGGFPWLQGYQGQLTAPMNPTELGAMGQYQNYIDALSQAQPGTPPSNLNPWSIPNFGGGAGQQSQNQAAMGQITQGLRGWQDYENQQALRRIASSSAAGGGALSGANMQAQSDYLNNANNLFNQTTGTMQLQNLQNYEGLVNQLAQSQIGAGATLGASGQYAGAQEYGAGLGYQENMANLQNQGIQNLFNMGQVGQNTEQNQYNAAYNDWLRQTGNMQQMFNYPAQLGLAQLGYGYPASQPNAYGSSQATQWAALLQQLLGGGGGGGGYANIIDQILNGYNQGSGGGTQQPPSGTQGNGLDAEPRYDGGTPPPNPTQLPMDQVQGRDYWMNLLNQSIANSNKAQNAGQPSAGAQTASGILSLLNLLAGGGAGGGGSRPASSGGASFGGTMGQGSAGSGQGLGLLGLIAKGVGALLKPSGQSKPGPVSASPPGAPSVQGAGGMGTSTGFDPNTGMPAGASMTTDPFGNQVGMIDPNNYNISGQPMVVDPNNQNSELAAFLQSIPQDYQATNTGDQSTWGYGQFGNYSDPSAFGTDNSGDVSSGDDAEDAVQ